MKNKDNTDKVEVVGYGIWELIYVSPLAIPFGIYGWREIQTFLSFTF